MARLEQNRRWHIASRILAAFLLGYILANTLGLLLSLALPLDRISGVVIGTLATFLIWGLSTMWAFWVNRTRTVWLGLLGGIVLSGASAAALYVLENQT